MPFNANDVFYQNPVAIGGVSHRIVDATVTLDAFEFFDAKELVAVVGIHDFLVTAMTGSNNDLAFIAKKAGTQTVTVALVDPSANNAVASVNVSGGDISVSLATGSAGAITSTAASLKALIEASAAASALVVVNLATGNDGTGVVTALTQTPLAGPTGTLPTLDVALESSADGENFFEVATFTQANDVGLQRGTFGFLDIFGHWVLTVGGTNPVFAVSISGIYKP
jgi:hypothetical protein